MRFLKIFILLLTQILWAQSPFEKGNDLYQKGKYQEAIAEYESTLATKKHSAELYFNLGNCYYKLNKVAFAVYNYEKALLLSPEDAEIQNNLKFAQKMQIDEVKEVPEVGFSKLIHNFTSIFHYDTWAWISVGLAILFLGLFLGYYLSQLTSQKRIFFIGMILAIVLISCSLLAAIAEKSAYDNKNPAIIFADMTVLKSEPQSSSNDVFTLHEGTKVYIQESMGKWIKVKLADGTDGWIDKSTVKKVK